MKKAIEKITISLIEKEKWYNFRKIASIYKWREEQLEKLNKDTKAGEIKMTKKPKL